MNSLESIAISAQLPVTITAANSEIVYNPETNAYALSLGVNIQLPISELVDVLLKFNQEQVVPSSPAVQGDTLVLDKASYAEIASVLSSLPAATKTEEHAPPPGLAEPSSTSPIYTPKSREIGNGFFPDDDFMRIPLTVIRQEPGLLEYRERSKWTTGKFFTPDVSSRTESNIARLTRGFELYTELPVDPQFLDQSEYMHEEYIHHPRSGSMDSGYSSTKPRYLSADAPVFTPGSAFASTAVTPSLESVRVRAMSDTFTQEPRSRDERAMSLAYLPPSALSVMREDTNWDAPQLERGESRPAECKQM